MANLVIFRQNICLGGATPLHPTVGTGLVISNSKEQATTSNIKLLNFHSFSSICNSSWYPRDIGILEFGQMNVC